MDQDFWAPFMGGLVRHGLTTVGGYLAAMGVVHGNAGVAQFVSAGMVLAGVGWSFWQKYGQKLVADELKSLASSKSKI